MGNGIKLKLSGRTTNKERAWHEIQETREFREGKDVLQTTTI